VAKIEKMGIRKKLKKRLGFHKKSDIRLSIDSKINTLILYGLQLF